MILSRRQKKRRKKFNVKTKQQQQYEENKEPKVECELGYVIVYEDNWIPIERIKTNLVHAILIKTSKNE